MIGWILFAINILLDIVAFWYIKELLRRFSYIRENSHNAYTSIEEYADHLQKVYDLETYYGDSTLSGLLAHSRDLKDELDIYKDLFSLGEDKENLNVEQENPADD
jgi:heme oxygenase